MAHTVRNYETRVDKINMSQSCLCNISYKQAIKIQKNSHSRRLSGRVVRNTSLSTQSSDSKRWFNGVQIHTFTSVCCDGRRN